jgi:tripartite-type tricarboxylate transporter receptor subunit TctC
LKSLTRPAKRRRVVSASGAGKGAGKHLSGDIMRPLRSFLIVAAAIAAVVLAAAGATAARAQDWPTRPVLTVSPFSAGAANEIVARVVLDQVAQQFGQTFVIETRPGGGGIIGVASVVRADPDGYTMLLSSASMSSAVILHKTLPYDAVRDLAPIAMFGIQPSVLVVAPSKGFKSVADLVAAAKARPGELNFASAGIGSASHIAGERFRVAAGLNVQHVPYRGPNEAFADVVTGRVDFYFLPIAPAVPLITQGKVLAQAVSTPKRAALLPDVPTIAEAGYPDAEYLFWGGISAPAKTPPAIVTKLHDEVQKALDMPAVREKLAKFGVEPTPMTPAEFGKFFADDIDSMVKLAKAAHIEPTD